MKARGKVKKELLETEVKKMLKKRKRKLWLLGNCYGNCDKIRE